MSFYDVLRRFQLLSGLEGEDLSRWSELCREASDEVRAMLKVSEKSLTEAQTLRLAYTAGALAFYKYSLFTSATSPQSFDAGEVRVTMGDSAVTGAKALFEQECRALSAVLSDTSFYFGRVKA